jgi:hypothetical protein
MGTLKLRRRLLVGTDRVIAVVLAALLAGTTLAFGGAVWWAARAIAALMLVLVVCWLLHALLEGRIRFLKSPLTTLGILAIALAVAQLAPLPAGLSRKISPRSHEIYSLGLFADRERALDPSVELPSPAPVRSPVSVDRAATLRWAAGATVCLVLFWTVSQFTDRLRRLYVIWGSVIAAFLLNTAIAVVQFSGGAGTLYGVFSPGKGPDWIPSAIDLANSPNTTVLRTAPAPNEAHPAWAALFPDRPFLVGSLMGGPDAYLALATVGLPLVLAMILQLMAPRGSRERLGVRLAESGQGSLVVLLSLLLVASTVVVGLLAGPLLSVPFAIALALVGFPCAWPSGLRWTGIGMTSVGLLGLGGGVGLRAILAQTSGANLVSAVGIGASMQVWKDALSIVFDFPLVGAGLGSFATIFPYYKSHDEAHTTALSSLLQWWVESGVVGLILLAIGVAWCLVRVPGAIRRVGTADRALAFGLIGSVVGFSLYATIHWSLELAAVAISASALGGVVNRWLAGGTDLFVERG